MELPYRWLARALLLGLSLWMGQMTDPENLLHYYAKFSNNPYGFVMTAFPWGEKGTVLENRKGPEPWQREVLESIGRRSLNPDAAIREATVSGNGVGKTALV